MRLSNNVNELEACVVMIRFGIPSDGALHKDTIEFLSGCGLDIVRPNPRSYTGEIVDVPGIIVHFQRAGDITLMVENQSLDVGIAGYDRYMETRDPQIDTEVLIGELGFGQCTLSFAVPEDWLDVSNLADLSEVAGQFRERGLELKIATKFPRLVSRFLVARGVNYFSIVPTSGTLEAAPAMGYADLIVDIISSGNTVKQNKLKTIKGGDVIASQACLIANRSTIQTNSKLQTECDMLTNAINSYLKSRA
ncbi:MAG: ATP phosphoribosyltransferase [Dehalococcoidia bacterium]